MIETSFLTKNELPDVIIEYVRENYNIATERTIEQLNPFLDKLVDNLVGFFEYPYVDKYYRDTYYNFYSKKHKSYKRDSIRISLFSDSVKDENFFLDTEESNKFLQDNFFGFFTIRPTTYSIIGNTFLSPKVLKRNDFVCCLCRTKTLINGKIIEVHGFPYATQDNEALTCSESVLINEMIYFGHKYPEYSLLLPSQLTKILNKQSFQRQLPSPGLPTENISFVLKKMGFGSVVYSSDKSNNKDLFSNDIFKELLYIYIESGIPIIATLSSKKSNHAVIIVGREAIRQELVYKTPLRKKLSIGNNISMFSDVFNEILVMNDNHPPYEMVEFDKPLWDKSSNSNYEIKSFIVPLYSKVHLEAYKFRNLLFILIDVFKEDDETKHIKLLSNKNKSIVRCFLASSRTYKNYIGSAEGISNNFKTLIIDKAMPKFIWIAEIIHGDCVKEVQKVDSIVVMDATESGEIDHLIFAANSNYLAINYSDDVKEDDIQGIMKNGNKYVISRYNDEVFYTFAHNLKGEHTKWLS